MKAADLVVVCHHLVEKVFCENYDIDEVRSVKGRQRFTSLVLQTCVILYVIPMDV